MSDNKKLRDRLAALCGWYEDKELAYWFQQDGTETRFMHHPFQDGDLNALAAVWPEGWPLCVMVDDDCQVSADSGRYSVMSDTEYDARLRLTVAVLEAMA